MTRGGPHFEGAEKVGGSSLARERVGRVLGNFFTLSYARRTRRTCDRRRPAPRGDDQALKVRTTTFPPPRPPKKRGGDVAAAKGEEDQKRDCGAGEQLPRPSLPLFPGSKSLAASSPPPPRLIKSPETQFPTAKRGGGGKKRKREGGDKTVCLLTFLFPLHGQRAE